MIHYFVLLLVSRLVWGKQVTFIFHPELIDYLNNREHTEHATAEKESGRLNFEVRFLNREA
jgi:hypothetical protein